MDLQHKQYKGVGKELASLAGREGLAVIGEFKNLAITEEAERDWGRGHLPPAAGERKVAATKDGVTKAQGLERFLREAGKAMNIRAELTELASQGPA